MKKTEYNEFVKYISEKNEMAHIVFINPKELVFEENVKMNCFYCGKYNRNWRCPPNLPNVDFEKMMQEFNSGAFIYFQFDIKDKEEYALIRNESSVILHKLLLSLEKWMWNHNSSNALSFIGGSCKLCKGGCGKEGCNNPYMSRSPLEATGVNIVKSAKKYGINVEFPTEKKLIRIGLLLWQEDE